MLIENGQDLMITFPRTSLFGILSQRVSHDGAHSASKNQMGPTQNDDHLDQVEHLEQDEKVDRLDPLEHINLLKMFKMITEKGQVECELLVSLRRHLV